jgi:hypothetical protein
MTRTLIPAVVAERTNMEAARRLDRLSPTRRRRLDRPSPTRPPATAERGRYIPTYTYSYMRIYTDTYILPKIHADTYEYRAYLHIPTYTHGYMQIYAYTYIVQTWIASHSVTDHALPVSLLQYLPSDTRA